mgnify:CR=1 FL=1
MFYSCIRVIRLIRAIRVKKSSHSSTPIPSTTLPPPCGRGRRRPDRPAAPEGLQFGHFAHPQRLNARMHQHSRCRAQQPFFQPAARPAQRDIQSGQPPTIQCTSLRDFIFHCTARAHELQPRMHFVVQCCAQQPGVVALLPAETSECDLTVSR